LEHRLAPDRSAEPKHEPVVSVPRVRTEPARRALEPLVCRGGAPDLGQHDPLDLPVAEARQFTVDGQVGEELPSPHRAIDHEQRRPLLKRSNSDVSLATSEA
jgi:hypothetical protein